MRILQASIALLLALPDEHSTVYSFTIPHPPFTTKCRTNQLQRHHLSALQMSSESEFDSILEESPPSTDANTGPSSSAKPTIVDLPKTSAAATIEEDDLYMDDGAENNVPIVRQETLSNSLKEGSDVANTKERRIEQMIRKKNERLAKKTQSSTPRAPISVTSMARNYVRGKDFGQLFVFTFLPAVVVYYFGSRALNMGKDKMVGKSADMLDDYADEMIYHDGDFEEMKLCHDDYMKKLMWMGPAKSEAMIKKYLEFYAKKKTVSPQAISSLSYVFQMNKFSEERSAEILSSLVASIPEKVASAGKILFFGNHIFKTEEARALLKPIEETLANQYRDMGPSIGGAEIVRKSQIAMGEAAYTNAVAADGEKGSKKKKKGVGSKGKDGEVVEEEDEWELTVGWEVLGLSRQTAEDIFDDVRDGGFRSEREKKYEALDDGVSFDKKGRRVKDDGTLENPDEALPDDDKDEDDSDGDGGGGGGNGSVYECSDCGYTIMIAKGRDFKFFGDDFKCPECGSGKDKMVGM